MIKQVKLWLIVSLITVLVCAALAIGVRPLWGIDFTGGSLLEVRSETVDPQTARAVLETALDVSVSAQSAEAGSLILRTRSLSEEEHQTALQALREAQLFEEELRFESIGPTIGAELRRKSILALAIVVAVLIAYLAYTFREASGLVSSWKFGLAAVYALVHDLLVVTALFVIFGKTIGVPIDTLFVTAMLAILGYSVNDTIVIFNRFRNDRPAQSGASLLESLDAAVRASLVRSLNTSLTTLIVLGALLLFGGTTIRWFVVALAAGTLVGTYSSLFVAPPALFFLAKRNT